MTQPPRSATGLFTADRERASLEELLLDYEDFLRQGDLTQEQFEESARQFEQMSNFEKKPDGEI